MLARMIFSSIAGCLLLALTGCGGPGSGPVTGKITAGGQPLKGGSISFVPKEKPDTPPVGAMIMDDGSFTVPDVPYGEMLVAIIPPAATQGTASSAAKAKRRMGAFQQRNGAEAPPEVTAGLAGNPAAIAPTADLVPLPVRDPLTTDLTFKHDAANGVFDYEFK